MWNYKTPGIPDEYFERAEKVPITKEEVRTITTLGKAKGFKSRTNCL
jgi:Precorrin-6B methylase 2